MEGYKGSLQQALGISEERAQFIQEIAEGIAKKMDNKELATPSEMLLDIEKSETTVLEKMVMAFRFGQIV